MSFILIGFGRQTRKDLGETGYTQICPLCTSSMFYHLIRSHTWLTFFFVPVFPYRSEYRIECPVCHNGLKLNRSEVKAAKQGTLKIYVTHDVC